MDAIDLDIGCHAADNVLKRGLVVAEEQQRAARDIHLLTTDALLADLVGGQAVAVRDGERLSLASDDARAVLDWYRRNPSKWAGNLNAGDAEAIVDAVGTPPPTLEPVTSPAASGPVRTIRLVKIVAHRFAGLHAYGRPTEPPQTFTFVPTKAMTLFEGFNGSGKTSIANAVIWCLTGHLIRSQRPPEAGPTEFPCEVTRDDGSLTTHPMSAVTPMPHGNGDLPADGDPIDADTWVELTFADRDGTPLPPIRREQSRTPRGKITEVPPDLDAVGIDPIAWRIATTMPALLPFLSVGSTSQLGQAVARLTGLADLVDLAKHATKASERIVKRTVKELQADLTGIETRYTDAATDLAGIVTEHSDLAFADAMPAVDAADAAARLTAVAEHFTGLKATALAEARAVLGDGFDPEDKAARDDLERNIRPAIEQLQHIKNLPSIARLSALSVDGSESASVVTLLAQIEAEAVTLAELAASPDRARRAQLYARVSSWMHEHGHHHDGRCPVCISDMGNALDPVSGTPVAGHLADAARDRDLIAQTIAQWSSHWCGELLRQLPAAIAAEARRDLPVTPANLLVTGLTDDLFASDGLRGALAALRPDAVALVAERIATLPAFDEPDARTLPAVIAGATGELATMMDRIDRALAFAEWRVTNKQPLLDVIQAVRRGEDGASDADRAIGRRLAQILAIVEGVTPLNTAITVTGRLEAARRDHAAKKERIARCGRAAAALDQLVPLGALAQAQVDALRTTLHTRSEYWRRAMYRNATQFAPDLTGTGMDAKGVLELKVGRQGVAAPAQHVSNASALRGALLGFFLAFREHVLAQRGGLATLILDDPQELLDNDNRERLARGLSRLASAGAQMIVTTHDRKFARCLVAEHRDTAEHLSVHPVNGVRPTLFVAPAIEEVDRKRQAFRDSPDNHVAAQDYAADLRVFLESRLGDLFDDIAHPAYAAGTRALTLIPLMDRLRSLVTGGTGELFTHPTVRRFVDDAALAEGAEARRVLNQSHHDKASITYMDVKAVEADLLRLRTNIEKVHEQFRLHRWREPLAPVDASGSNVVVLRPIAKPTFAVPICPDIAAFVGPAPGGGSQDVAVDRLDGDWFEGKAFYYVRSESLGFAIPSGAVAIVETEPYPGRDQNLVVAHHRGQVMARRMVKSPGSIGISLSAQMPDPRARRPTVTCDESKVRLHRVAGAIFTAMPPPAGASGEAAPVDAVPELDGVAVAYRVKEESAVPLALPGQIILGGAELTPAGLDGWFGRLVAVTLDDGSSVFKRVGARLPGHLGHLRQFETIGGLGSSLVVATEALDSDAGVPLMISARRVIGVLYDGT